MKILSLIIALLLSIPVFGQESETPKTWQNTWTYTYIKAKENQRNNLKQFIIRNWFAMDSVAVQKGLFNDYQL